MRRGDGPYNGPPPVPAAASCFGRILTVTLSFGAILLVFSRKSLCQCAQRGSCSKQTFRMFFVCYAMRRFDCGTLRAPSSHGQRKRAMGGRKA